MVGLSPSIGGSCRESGSRERLHGAIEVGVVADVEARKWVGRDVCGERCSRA